MPSTFTPILNLEKPANGEQNLTWGNTVDANYDKIDAAIGTGVIRSPATANADLGGFRLTNIALAEANADGARLDQVAWVEIAIVPDMTGGTNADFVLPAGYRKFRAEWASLGGNASSGTFYSSFSLSNGANYDSGTSYQFGVNTRPYRGAQTYASDVERYAKVFSSSVGNQVNDGWFEFNIYTGKCFFANMVSDSSSITETSGWINYTAGTPTNIRLGVNSGIITGGAIRLTGWKI